MILSGDRDKRVCGGPIGLRGGNVPSRSHLSSLGTSFHKIIRLVYIYIYIIPNAQIKINVEISPPIIPRFAKKRNNLLSFYVISPSSFVDHAASIYLCIILYAANIKKKTMSFQS